MVKLCFLEVTGAEIFSLFTFTFSPTHLEKDVMIKVEMEKQNGKLCVKGNLISLLL